ncbi:MAG: SGNH/GDSL hydrolase family protein [Planctomycetes bacterium]|nr:SGNH/GDSL hydrolase family protein [Planctomycetota bacterium]
MKSALKIILLAVLVLLLAAVVSRTWASPDMWLHWVALATTLLGVVAAGLSLRKPSGKPRWFHLRPVVVAVCSLFVGLFYFVMRVPAPMGEGPAGPPVDRQAFAGTWSEQPVLLLSLGDSVSTGYGAPSGMGYVDLLQRNLDDAYPDMAGCELRKVLPNLKERRLAANSTNSLQHVRDIQNLPVYGGDVFGIVCITTGGIDLIHKYGKAKPREGAMYGADWATAELWIANFNARLDEMMLALKQKFPGGCVVLVATIYDPTDGVGDIENAGPLFWLPAWKDGYPVHTAFNDAIKACAAKHDHVHVADIHAAMMGHGIHCRDEDNPHYDADDPSYWYWVNLEDPNRRGYDAIRRVFLNAIIRALRAHRAFDVPAPAGP